MALFETLERMGGVDEDVLAWAYSSRYRRDPERGYGKMARRILKEIGAGEPWETVSKNAFGGGSFGNGAAMRVAPLGAYFADEPERLPELATRTARVTHFHPEGIAGAIAVAVATAAAVRAREARTTDAAGAIWDAALDLTPRSEVRARLEFVRDPGGESPISVAREVGMP